MATDTLKSTLEMQGSFLQGRNCWAVAPTVFLLQWAGRAEGFWKVPWAGVVFHHRICAISDIVGDVQ